MKQREDTLYVKISYFPAIRHLKETDRKISHFYRYTTEIVMEVLVSESGWKFSMNTYDEETGAAEYSLMR